MWAAAALFALLLTPVFLLGLTRWQNEHQIDFVYVPIHHMLSHAFSAFAAGVRPTFVAPLWQTGPLVGLALVGAWCVVRSFGKSARRTLTSHVSHMTPLLLIAWLFIPILSLNLLSGQPHLQRATPPDDEPAALFAARGRKPIGDYPSLFTHPAPRTSPHASCTTPLHPHPLSRPHPHPGSPTFPSVQRRSVATR
ncbi:MAG: hypothetical protein IPL78_29560 [Chloroflexi bacterium]|nr:hypothetical protein [Chloroflexota bacterium]